MASSTSTSCVVIAICPSQHEGCIQIPYVFADGHMWDDPSNDWITRLVEMKNGRWRQIEHKCIYCQHIEEAMEALCAPC